MGRALGADHHRPDYWRRKPRRVCQTVHSCALCGDAIRYGEAYFDGGYGHRAHEACVDLNWPPEATGGY